MDKTIENIAPLMDRNHIPRLVEDYSIVPYNEKQFTLCIEAERAIKLNIDPHTKRLLEQVDGESNLEKVTEKFNADYELQLSVDNIVEIFNKTIAGFGILEGDNNERIKIKDDYLKLRFQIFPTRVVEIIASKLVFLYSQEYFKYAFLGVLSFLLLNYFFFMDFEVFYEGLDPSFLTFMMVVSVLGVVIHEFGHAAACIRFGAKNGPIGFGFYFVLPVMYSDVSDAWRLNRKERIIVDLGGIYIQLIFTSLLLLPYYFTRDVNYLHLSFLIMLLTLINLNPWLRYDGYWALSDILKISNLRDKAHKTVMSFFRWCMRFDTTWENTPRKRFLLIYGMSRTAVLIAFLVYVLLFRKDSILNLPGNLLDTFTVLFTDFSSIDFDWIKSRFRQLLIPVVFCVIFTKEFIKYLQIRVKK